VYCLMGVSGLNNEWVMITNFFSFYLLADPYHFLHFLACSATSFPCTVTRIRKFDHVAPEYMVPLSIFVLAIGLLGFASVISAMAKLKVGYYALLVLAVLASAAAVFDILWVVVNVPLFGFSFCYTAVPGFWVITYLVAVRNLKFARLTDV